MSKTATSLPEDFLVFNLVPVWSLLLFGGSVECMPVRTYGYKGEGSKFSDASRFLTSHVAPSQQELALQHSLRASD